MVDGKQLDLVKVNQLFHHFSESEAQPAIAQLNAVSFNSQVLRRIGSIVPPGSYPVAHDACPNHVRNKFVPITIPCPHDRTRTSAPVDLVQDMAATRGELNLILHDAGWPEEPDDIRLFCAIDSGDDFLRVLPEIAR